MQSVGGVEHHKYRPTGMGFCWVFVSPFVGWFIRSPFRAKPETQSVMVLGGSVFASVDADVCANDFALIEVCGASIHSLVQCVWICELVGGFMFMFGFSCGFVFEVRI